MTANTGTPLKVDLPLLGTSIVVLADDEFRYRGGRCSHCAQLHYPYSEHCIRCGNVVEEEFFSAAGKVYSFTSVQTKAPYGLPEPYTVGYIELEENGLQVFGLFAPEVAEHVEIGMDVEVALQAIGLDGHKQPCLRPVFTAMDWEGTR